MKTPMRRILMPLSLWAVAIGATTIFLCPSAHASSYDTILYNFGTTAGDPNSPAAPLIFNSAGDLLGTAEFGGANRYGAAFSFAPTDGPLSILCSFGATSTDGLVPGAPLVDDGGDYYGTTEDGGADDSGTVYVLNTNGTDTVLHSFGTVANDGISPTSGLVTDSTGTLYGTTTSGGAYDEGTVYKVSGRGGYAIVYNFGATDVDAAYPVAGLIRDAKGNFYGVTQDGGEYGAGSIYEITAANRYMRLYDFGTVDNDGYGPVANLFEDASGDLYGTTVTGGEYGDGVLFELSASGEYTLLHTFGSVEDDGEAPHGTLIMADDGNLYGTASSGGANNDGTVYRITPTGYYQSFSDFGEITNDGQTPVAGLVQGSNSTLYGTTAAGGSDDEGTIYSVPSNVPLITSFSPTSGPVGTVVTITGTSFTGTTAVQFGGTQAASGSIDVTATQIKATVPAGATTATITIFTPSGGFSTSNLFFVSHSVSAPTITSFTPTSGPVGTSVTITGTNFTGATAVKFNTTAATTFTVVSATSITATVPTGATTGKVSVTTSGGSATSTGSFTVSTTPAPTITSFTPTSGAVGTSVTITGTNFTGATAVKFNGTGATTYSVVSATSIKATVPTGATTGKISVTTASGTATSTGTFTVTAGSAPTITSFTPTSGPVKTDVSITGTNFTGATAVKFNGVAATTFNVDSATLIKALVPNGATSGKITVTTPSGTATSTASFTVN